MQDKEAIDMMQRCSGEIKMLRQQIAELAPKADAYDLLATTINTMAPRRSQVMGEDLAWTLDRRVEKLREAIKASADPQVESADH